MRRIIVILALGLLIYVIRRLQGARRPVTGPRAGPAPPGGSEPLVRDRICNTFISPAAALCVERDGVRHFFCSPACRDTFLKAADGNLTPSS